MIKNISSLSFLLLALSSLSTPVVAKKTIVECEKQGQKIESISRCLDGVKESFDRELQTWVNSHIFNMEEQALVTGRHSALKMFKKSQGSFITFRDNNCRWQYLAISPNKGADITYKKCYIIITQHRINELSTVK